VRRARELEPCLKPGAKRFVIKARKHEPDFFSVAHSFRESEPRNRDSIFTPQPTGRTYASVFDEKITCPAAWSKNFKSACALTQQELEIFNSRYAAQLAIELQHIF
jgi:hypothetical protein